MLPGGESLCSPRLFLCSLPSSYLFSPLVIHVPVSSHVPAQQLPLQQTDPAAQQTLLQQTPAQHLPLQSV